MELLVCLPFARSNPLISSVCSHSVAYFVAPDDISGALLSISNSLASTLPLLSPQQWIQPSSTIFNLISEHSLDLEDSILSEFAEEDVIGGMNSLLEILSCEHVDTLRLFDREMPVLPIPAESMYYQQTVYFVTFCRFRFGVPLLYLLSFLKHRFTQNTNQFEEQMKRLIEQMARCAGFLNLFDAQLLSEIPNASNTSSISQVFGQFYAILDAKFHKERSEGDSQQWEAFLCDRFTSSISVDWSIRRFHNRNSSSSS